MLDVRCTSTIITSMFPIPRILNHPVVCHLSAIIYLWCTMYVLQPRKEASLLNIFLLAFLFHAEHAKKRRRRDNGHCSLTIEHWISNIEYSTIKLLSSVNYPLSLTARYAKAQGNIEPWTLNDWTSSLLSTVNYQLCTMYVVQCTLSNRERRQSIEHWISNIEH